MEHEPQPAENEPSALEQLQQWLLERGVSAKDVPLIVERVKAFYATASVILDFPTALAVSRDRKARGLRFDLIWPAPFAPAERPKRERKLRSVFQREVASPLAPTVSCRLAFVDTPPDAETGGWCYLGPRPDGYAEFAASFLATRQALDQSPAIAQELSEILDTLPEKSVLERSALASRVGDLVTQLHSRH